MRVLDKVTSIRVDSKLWKRAKLVAVEEDMTLSELIKEALSIVVDWREIADNFQISVNEELLERMIRIRKQGQLPFVISSEKTAVELVREGRDRWL